HDALPISVSNCCRERPMTTTSSFPDLTPIPAQIETRDGQQVETRLPIWQLRTYARTGTLVTLNWPMLEEIAVGETAIFSLRAIHLMKLFLAHRLQRKSPATALKDIQRLRTLGRWLATEWIANDASQLSGSFEWSQFNEQTAQAYVDWCLAHRASADALFASVRMLYKWGVARKFSDFTLP